MSTGNYDDVLNLTAAVPQTIQLAGDDAIFTVNGSNALINVDAQTAPIIDFNLTVNGAADQVMLNGDVSVLTLHGSGLTLTHEIATANGVTFVADGNNLTASAVDATGLNGYHDTLLLTGVNQTVSVTDLATIQADT